MTEELLQYIWQHRLYNSYGLSTTRAEPLEILQPGIRNTDAGPDFANARIRIGETLWAGNVEVHLRASDWHRHRHSADPAYNNVVLHVVLHADSPIMDAAGRELCTVCLPVPDNIPEVYRQMISGLERPPCGRLLGDLNQMSTTGFLYRLATERLEYKSDNLTHQLKAAGNDWEQIFYASICRVLGYSPNVQPFEELARAMPFALLRRYATQRSALEALLFGQAGLLTNPADEYMTALSNEYRFLKQKHSLGQPVLSGWKYSRVRPGNFPPLRIAQLASLLAGRDKLFAQAMEVAATEQAYTYFAKDVSHYWTSRYQFGQATEVTNAGFGKATINSLIINVLVPFQFVYGRHTNQDKLCANALHLLDATAPERNALTRPWVAAGLALKGAMQSQALTQLHKEYCTRQRCLHCQIGFDILSNRTFGPKVLI